MDARSDGLNKKSKDMSGLADRFEGVTEADGEYFNCGELEEGDEEARREANEPHAFKAVLDIGLARTNTGARPFAILKGAVDGGLDIPHEEKRFPGYDETEDDPDSAMDTEILNGYIHGNHIAEYMEELEEEDPELYEKQFSKYVAAGISGGDLEALYTEVHAKIRENPLQEINSGDYKEWGAKQRLEHGQKKRLGYAQRKAKIKQKIAYGMHKLNSD